MATVNTNYARAVYQNTYVQEGPPDAGKTEKSVKEQRTGANSWVSAGEKTTEVTGTGTYGKPKLSEEGMKYYQSLLKKYDHLNFVLVSSNKKQEAETLKGGFANSSQLTILIDTDKIEQMARDEEFRSKYEGILRSAKSEMNQLQSSISSSGVSVNAFGMSLGKDGSTSFFAVMDRSMTVRRERLAKRQAEKSVAQKEENKEKAEKTRDTKEEEKKEARRTETLAADSIEELVRKVQEYYQQGRFDSVRTQEEMQVGSKFNFGV